FGNSHPSHFPISIFQFLSQNQLAVPCQLLLHLLVHFLIRDACPPHLVLMVNQDLAYFFVEPVLDGQLFKHFQAYPVRHGRGSFGFDVSALDQPFHDLVGHVGYIVPKKKHLSAFPLHKCKRVSLLAALIKCKETRKTARKIVRPRSTNSSTHNSGNVAFPLGHCRIMGDRPASENRKIRPALTLLAASCTMNWVRALSSAVRAFGLHPKGRPFKSDSAHHPCASLHYPPRGRSSVG